jgi:hypothetical protein
VFFRDIRPYGWNLALGTSERWWPRELSGQISDELDANYTFGAEQDTFQFIAREFFEETIVVSGEPNQVSELSWKRFSGQSFSPAIPTDRLNEFASIHRKLREERDGIKLTPAREPKPLKVWPRRGNLWVM